MKITTPLFLGLYTSAFIISSCNEQKEKVISPAAEVSQPVATADLSGCWQMTLERDTAYMELTQRGDSVSGPLSYRRFEKDSNTGMVRMLRKGDRAEGWYVFQSEGMTSARQIVFHLSEAGMGEGYGDVEIRGNDSVYYKYPQALNFEEKHAFTRVPCVP